MSIPIQSPLYFGSRVVPLMYEMHPPRRYTPKLLVLLLLVLCIWRGIPWFGRIGDCKTRSGVRDPNTPFDRIVSFSKKIIYFHNSHRHTHTHVVVVAATVTTVSSSILVLLISSKYFPTTLQVTVYTYIHTYTRITNDQ